MKNTKYVGSVKFVSTRFDQITTSEEWRKAFPERYKGKLGKVLSEYDFKHAKFNSYPLPDEPEAIVTPDGLIFNL